MGLPGHVLTFPIERGETMKVVAFRKMREGKWDDEEWVLSMRKDDMTVHYRGMGPEMQGFFGLYREVGWVGVL